MSPTATETDDTELRDDAVEAEAPSEETTSRFARVVGWVRSLSPRDRLHVVSGVVSAVVVWVVTMMLTGGDPAPAPEPDPTAPLERGHAVPDGPRPLPTPPATLTTEEYLKLGRGALAESRVEEARRHFEAALETGPTDRRVRAEICLCMADVCQRVEQVEAAVLYREEAAALLSGLSDSALAVFALAEAELAEGRVRAARRMFHAIALGGGQAGPVDVRLRSEAGRRLAKTYEAEFSTMHTSQMGQMSDPPVFVGSGR